MSIKFFVIGGGILGLGGGGTCGFYFYGREDFSDSRMGRPQSADKKFVRARGPQN